MIKCINEMDYINNVERVLNCTLGLDQLKNLRTSFGALDVSKNEKGKMIMGEIIRRIDNLEPDTLGARYRRCVRNLAAN